MRILVTGGRSFNGRFFVYEKLDEARAALGITEVVHGAATGADSLAKDWAISRGLQHHPEPVEEESWQRLGGRAGNARNSFMLRKWSPRVVIGFPGGTGTTDMIVKARAAGIPACMSWSSRWAEMLAETAHKLVDDHW